MLRNLLSAALAGLSIVATVSTQNIPTGFNLDTLVSSGLQAGNDFTFLPDGRILIASRAGAVHVFAEGVGLQQVGTVSSIQTGSERALLSIEADPGFATNGYIYVWYSSSQTAYMHLDRLTCTGALNNATSTNLSFSMASRRTIINSSPDSAFNHNGGSARFGPDGMLYLSIGDDANACTAQSLTSKSGCLLRMDVSGLPTGPSSSEPSYNSIDPGDNPNSSANNWTQLVIAYGLRNPFRMEVDQVTGNCFIGDVGQNAAEEYSLYVRQSNLQLVNFGWPWREGNLSYSSCGGGLPSGLVGPLRQETGGSWNSIVGGPQYRNAGSAYDFGTSYEGDAFYLDYFGGVLRRIKQTGNSWNIAPQVPGQPSSQSWGTGFNGTTAMRMGPDGAIYFLQHPNTYATNGGFLKRIRSTGPTNSVIAVSGADQRQPHGETFPQPVRARVLDTNGNPLPGGAVNFSVTGGHVLSTTNPVIADANGYAQTTVTASGPAGGPLTVTASTPGGQTNGTFRLFARKLTATGVVGASTLLVLSVINETDAIPANVPYIVLMSYPGVTPAPSPIGPICTNPSYFLTLAIEDGVGAYGGISYSGTGGVGFPNKTWLYQGLPNWIFQGNLMRFQVLGLDPVDGWFRTNCELEQF